MTVWLCHHTPHGPTAWTQKLLNVCLLGKYQNITTQISQFRYCCKVNYQKRLDSLSSQLPGDFFHCQKFLHQFYSTNHICKVSWHFKRRRPIFQLIFPPGLVIPSFSILLCSPTITPFLCQLCSSFLLCIFPHLVSPSKSNFLDIFIS